MRGSVNDTAVSSGDWDRLEEILDRFERSGPRTGPVDFTGFIPPPDDALHTLVLSELVKSDLEIRWRAGRAVVIEDYLKRYPQLREDSGALTQLLFEEYTVRRRHGDKPSLTGYRVRFPNLYADLERLARGQDGLAEALPPSDAASQTATDLRRTGSRLPVVGGYTLIKRLGAGNFGEVWQAEAPGGVEAAIKIIIRPLHHSEAKRELEALELMKRLRHPFLLQTQAFWSLEDRLMIALELADGSLRDRLKACVAAGQPGIPVEELLAYTREASEALDYLHSKQVLHRDIKPDNILLLEHHAKVADFGLARVLQAQMAKMTVSGTPAFMPPEAWSGRATDRSDQYSLAGSYVELRLNRDLFPSRDMAGAMLDHFEKTPDLEVLPEAERKVLLRALAKKPDERFATCREFATALSQALGHGGGSIPVFESGPGESRTWRQPSTAAARPPADAPGDATPTQPQLPTPASAPWFSNPAIPNAERRDRAAATLDFGQMSGAVPQSQPVAPSWAPLPHGRPSPTPAVVSGSPKVRRIRIAGVAVLLALLGGIVGLGAAYFKGQPNDKGGEWDPLESTCRHASLSIL